MKLYGKNPVLERLKTRPQTISRIYLEPGHPEAGYLYQKAKKHGIPIVPVPAVKIQKLARNVNAQGILADVSDFQYTPFEDLLEKSLSENKSLLFLDRLNDPQNLGVIIRSLACLGGFHIVLPVHESVEVTETVLRIASGGENHLDITRVKNLGQALSKARDAGFWIAGAVVKEGDPVHRVRLRFPLAFVIGSEQKGIREVIQEQLDARVTIPMAVQRMSLNAAQAATIFAYEITRQKNEKP